MLKEERVAEPITFIAALHGTTAIRFDAEGGGRLVLAFDDQQTPDLVRLLALRGRLIKVTCDPYLDGPGKK